MRIDVDLDGRDSTGAGFGDDTSVASLATDLDNLPSVSATVNPDGTLSITTDQGSTSASATTARACCGAGDQHVLHGQGRDGHRRVRTW